MSKKITIYTKKDCQYCDKIKQFLAAKGHDYTAVNLDEEPERRQEAIDISGAYTVPVTVIEGEDDSKDVVVGFNLQKLVPILAS